VTAADRKVKMSEDFSGLFASETEVISLAPGEVLFEKGEPGHLMYVVKSGSLQILDGNYVYETVSAGGVVGEMALVDGSPRSATAGAIQPSTVIAIDERRFLFMVQQTPFFALRLMRVITARLRAMNERSKAGG
jgi:CRP/FNR family cyclic AMP-dependent transcriptional regulator